jgi:phosphomannomutase
VLPVLAVIVASRPGRIRDLLDALPPRVTCSDRIQNFATEAARAIFAALLEGDTATQIARLNGCFGALPAR